MPFSITVQSQILSVSTTRVCHRYARRLRRQPNTTRQPGKLVKCVKLGNEDVAPPVSIRHSSLPPQGGTSFFILNEVRQRGRCPSPFSAVSREPLRLRVKFLLSLVTLHSSLPRLEASRSEVRQSARPVWTPCLSGWGKSVSIVTF